MSQLWQPAAEFQQLRQRAQLLNTIREFFAARQVLEVETPLLCRATGSDPQLDFFASRFNNPPHDETLYLQTSPEFAMKRLLAAGSGSIYQICKAFRNGEAGRWHNPEFTILEWYRVGFGLPELMQEVADLLQQVLGSLEIVNIAYSELFQQTTGLNPLVFDLEDYCRFADSQNLAEAETICGDSHSTWLDFLFSHCVETAMLKQRIYLVHGYPAIQSSLARINCDDPRIAERFEVFVNGAELGNGFHELCDAAEQEARFDREIAYRRQHDLPAVEKDQRLLDALAAGLPDCSGIAIGLDRLLMLATGSESIEQVLAFPLRRC